LCRTNNIQYEYFTKDLDNCLIISIDKNNTNRTKEIKSIVENYQGSNRNLFIEEFYNKDLFIRNAQKSSKSKTMRNIEVDIINENNDDILNTYENESFNPIEIENIHEYLLSTEPINEQSEGSIDCLSKILIDEDMKDENSFKILIMDDEELIRKSMKNYFHKINKKNSLTKKIEAFYASDGFEGLYKIYESYKNKSLINLVITDESMPLLNGSDIVKLIKGLSKPNPFEFIKFISYTSYSNQDKIDSLIKIGSERVIVKPVSLEEFENVLKMYI
jgi:CheY-like chemotaxis protein